MAEGPRLRRARRRRTALDPPVELAHALASQRRSRPASGSFAAACVAREREVEKHVIAEGRCYCGALRYRAEGDPLFRGQCHCRECQYISGGHPNVVLAMPAAGFAYTKGQPKTFRRSDLPAPAAREFCAECGTHTVTRSPSVPGAVLIKVGTLDDPSLFGAPQMVIFTVDKQAFHHVPQGVPTFERRPG